MIPICCPSIWERIDSSNLDELSDYAAYRRSFEQLYDEVRAAFPRLRA